MLVSRMSLVAAAVIAAVGLTGQSQAQTPEQFYKGKNFDVVIDFGRMRVDLAPTGLASLFNKLEEPIPEEKGRVPP